MKKFVYVLCSLAFIFSCTPDDNDDSGGDLSVLDCPNPSVSVNSMSCGGQSYRTVNINGQVWMAENLNYNPSMGNSVCYNNDSANCVTYGRLYDWSTANGVCPSGWHLPSNADWDRLYRYADGTSGMSSPYKSPTAGRYLNATSGWSNCSHPDSGNSYLSEDTYGFSALPGGLGHSGGGLVGSFFGVKCFGYWWSSSTEDDNDGTYSRSVSFDEYAIWEKNIDKNFLFSVRCLQDVH